MWLSEDSEVDVGHVLVGICLIPVVAVLFFGFSVVCEGYLSPKLTDLCRRLQIPNEVGAATILALGASAPEVAISSIGVGRDETEITIPCLVAVATLTFGLVPGLLLLRSGHRDLFLDTWITGRDGAALIASLFLLAILMHRTPRLGAIEAAALCFLYLAYLVVIVLLSPIETPEIEDKSLPLSSSAVTTQSQQQQEEEEGASKLEELLHRYITALRFPFEFICERVIRGGPIQQFTTTLLFISLFSYGAVEISLYLAYAFGASKASVGVIVLALGSQFPDLLAALDLAEKGGGATVGLSQAGASQVLNLTVGIGLPILVNRLFTAAKVNTRNADDIVALIFLCIAMVLSYLLLVLAFARRAPNPATFKLRWFWRCLPEWAALRPRPQALMNRSHGIALVLLCLIFYSMSIIDSETHKYPGVSQWSDHNRDNHNDDDD